jgi:hypothetical protein
MENRIMLFEAWVEAQMNEEMMLPAEFAGMEDEVKAEYDKLELDDMCPAPGKLDATFLEKKFVKALEKGMGGADKVQEFVKKFQEMLANMDKAKVMELLKTLKGYLKNPKEGKAYIDELVMKSNEGEINEYVDMTMAFFIGQLVIAIFLTLLKLGAFGKIEKMIGCQRSY